jgi:chromosome segregation ATPase
MELQEALEVVQQVKNRYKAFDKLDELLSFFVGEYQKLPGLKDQVAALQKELSDLNTKRDQALLEAGILKKSINEEVAAQRGKANSEISNFGKKVQTETAKYQHQFEQVRGALKKLEAEHEGKMDAMRTEALTLEGSISQLREQLQSLRKMVEAVNV